MQLDINLLIPVGTFAIGMVWVLVVVYFEHVTTAEQEPRRDRA